MNLQSTGEIPAPLPEWVAWVAVFGWFTILFFALAKADRLTIWARYGLARWKSYRWKAAGNKERRSINRPIRPGRWQ